MEKKRFIGLLALLLIGLILLGCLSLFLGSELIAPGNVWNALLGEGQQNYKFIVQQIRLPRVLTSMLAGVALSVAGLQMQSYFRNGLAGPYILGISAGSGLGVAIMLMAGTVLGFEWQSGASLPLPAIIGAVGVLAIMLLLARKVGSGVMLLIVGVMLGSFISATISVLEYFAPAESMKKYVIWTMGSTSDTSLSEVGILFFVVITGLLMAIFSIKSLNALLLGEDYASSLGVSVKRTRWVVMISTGLLAGGITAYCGPIAFVGLAVPHLVRMIVPTVDHKMVLPVVALVGGVVMVVCDIIAELPGLDTRLPINAVTSILGAPVVIFVILKNRVHG